MNGGNPSASVVSYTGTVAAALPWTPANSNVGKVVDASFVLSGSHLVEWKFTCDAKVPSGQGVHVTVKDGGTTLFPLNGGNGDYIWFVPSGANESGFFALTGYATLAAGSHDIEVDFSAAILVGAITIYTAQLEVTVY